MMLTDRQKFALALRRLQRAFAVAIYPPFGYTELSELDGEFQNGLEIGINVGTETEQASQLRRDVKAGKRKVTRSVMGQNDDGTPNGEDYTEERYVTDWRKV